MRIKNAALAGLMAALLIPLAASSASALRSLEASSTLITLLSLALTLGSPELGVRIICSVGLTLSLSSRSFAKGEKVIGRALVRILNPRNECSGGKLFVVGGPFEVKYLSFIGTLPRIEGLNLAIVRLAWLAELGPLSSCEYIVNLLGFQITDPATGVVKELRGERVSNGFRVEEMRSTRLGGVNCIAASTLEGVFLPTGTTVTIRLT